MPRKTVSKKKLKQPPITTFVKNISTNKDKVSSYKNGQAEISPRKRKALQENNNNNNNETKQIRKKRKHLDQSSFNNNNNNNNNDKDLLDVAVENKKKISKKAKNKDIDSSVEKTPQQDSNENMTASPTYSSDSPSKTPRGPLKLKCTACDEVFPSHYFRRKHCLMAHNNQMYQCFLCTFCSVAPEKLKSHILKIHVAKKEKAEHNSVDQMLKEIEDLIARQAPRKVVMQDGVFLGKSNSSSKIQFLCDICDRLYVSKYSLERHLRCHTGDKPYKCNICDFSTSYREHMNRHIKYVHLIIHSSAPQVKYSPKQKVLKDEVVEDDDQNESESSKKKRRNILRERFECAACGLRSTHKSDLNEHIKEKHPNAHIESLSYSDGSKVHLIMTNKQVKKKKERITIVCEHCSMIFHDTWKYKVHLRSHTGVKPFECSICQFQATSKMTVRDHVHRKHAVSENAKILIHTVSIDGSVEKIVIDVPTKEFICNICKEKFTDNYEYKRHKVKSHPDDQPFSCSLCGQKEQIKASLIVHCLQEHEDVPLEDLVLRYGKPAKVGVINLPKCNDCGKYFPYRSSLAIHMRSHTGEKSLRCDVCDFGTNNKLHLQNHIISVHFGLNKSGKGKKGRPKKTSNEDLNCAICSFTCKSRESFQKHILAEHCTSTGNLKEEAKWEL